METADLELKKLPMVMTSTGEALMTLMDIIASAKESLLRILIQGDFSEYPDNHSMHGTAPLADMLSKFSDDLQAKPKQVREFLMDEIMVLEECKCVGLPNFIPRSAFMAILSQHVDDIHAKPVEFIKNIWDYIEVVLSSVITKYSENFPQVQFADAVLNDKTKPESFSVNGFGSVKISHQYHAHLLQQAFDMKMRITSYWKIVLRRIVDNLALYLQLSVKYFVNTQFQKEIVAEMVDPKGGGGVERMLEESPSVASKREKLKKSIKVLKESKDAVAAIVDQ
ncbi:hypothetical protein DY000_02041260 [Brassica cretica]|nr:hypothetical protein DY000_02041260 [Brassica cretica]